ncbi:tetratricopeptide repeat protein [Massilia sp. CCM 8695]|uniref:Tetratricopeptide repeat protein n=1 Tax=Massilia frigida TaxID=2609281 RepID=A0ABX0ND38_9BURK|nr:MULTISPECIES: tetratricopeptide repeat protein [Massilia]MDM5179179.1 tetratricopeptide repeat protein [Massilia sp. DJPM01]NHZ80774.1 tetratricopeptide repeat protein [Massilia frigida]
MPQADQLQAQTERFESFLSSDPDNASLLTQLGELYLQAGKLDQALEAFQRVIALTPGAAVAHGRLATVYLALHRFGEAGASLQGLIDGGENDAALFHNLGLALYYQERYADAAKAFASAQQYGIDNANNARYLAHCLHHEGDLDAANAACEHWVSIAGDPDSNAYLSLVNFDMGERERAGALAQQVLAEHPDSVDANAVAGALALEKQDIDAASASFERILSQRADNGRAWLGLGLTLMHKQNNVDAIAAMTRASVCMPGHAGTLIALGWAKLNAGDAVGAEQAFRDAVDADRNFAESHGGLAAALVTQGRIEEAKLAMTLANKLDSANFGSVYTQAALLKLDGRAELADRLIERALRQSPLEGTPTLFEHLATFLSMRPK